MPHRDIVVIGASAGGVEALAQLVRSLPGDLPAALFVVVHFPPQGMSILPHILNRAGPLPAGHASDGESIRPGRIYVAVPDYHLLTGQARTRPGRAWPERALQPARCRPAVSLGGACLRAAGHRGHSLGEPRRRDRRAHGRKGRGGVAVVQDPDDALFPHMPRNALQYVTADYVVPLADLPPLLERLVHESVAEREGEEATAAPGDQPQEVDFAEMNMVTIGDEERPGTPSAFACPECGGTLWELQDGELLRFRCRVGHAFSADSLLAAQSDALEEALWSALRALEENASLARRMAARMRERNFDLSAANFEERAREAEQRAELIRRILANGETGTRGENSENP